MGHPFLQRIDRRRRAGSDDSINQQRAPCYTSDNPLPTYQECTEIASDQARLHFYTGLRVGECAALDLDDVPLSARKWMVIVRTLREGT
jgi:integrase